MKNGTCKGCGAAIIWIRTPGGKTMPCDPDPAYYREREGASGKIVTPNGMVLSADIGVPPSQATGYGYISHFSTCPAADRFRRRQHE